TLRVSTKKTEGLCVAEAVPEMLQPHGGAVETVGPHEGHHLPKRPDLAPPFFGAGKNSRDHFLETLFIGPSAHHERIESLFCVERDVLVLVPCPHHIESCIRQPRFQCPAVGGCANHDHGFPFLKARQNEPFQRVEKHHIIT